MARISSTALLALALVLLLTVLLSISTTPALSQPATPPFAHFDITPAPGAPPSTSTIPWAARSNHAVFTTVTQLAYTSMVNGFPMDQMAPVGSFILLGGVDANVWISPDMGVSWVLLAGPLGNSAPWNLTVQSQYRTTFTNDQSQAICKESTTDRIYVLLNQRVSWSDDGRTWSSRTVSALPNRAWFSCIAGRTNVFSIANPVWASADRGVTWVARPAQVFSSGGSSASTLYYSSALSRDILVVAGGLGSGRTGTNAVWVSSDEAQTWALVSSNAPWPARYDLKIAANTNGVLVVAFGRPDDTNQYNDVWMSADGGYNWWLLRNFATTTPRNLPAVIFDQNDYLWVFGGEQFIYVNNVGTKALTNTYTRSTRRFDSVNLRLWAPRVVRNLYLPPAQCIGLTCWPGQTCTCYNPDDFNFRFVSRAPFGLRQNVGFTYLRQAMPYVGRLNISSTSTGADNPLVAKTAPVGTWITYGGFNTAGPADSWISTDLQRWEPLSGAPAAAIGLSPSDYTNATVESGQSRCASSTRNLYFIMAATSGRVWSSPDGRNWTLASSNALASRSWAICFVNSTDAVYHLYQRDLRVSVDLGVTWRLVNTTRSFPVRDSPFGVSYVSRPLGNRDLLVMMGGVSGSVNFNDVWVTSDHGVSWFRTTSAAAWPARADASAAVDSNGLLVVLMGQAKGFLIRYNDAWFSADGGYSWWELTSSDAVTSRTFPGVALSPTGYLVTVAGAAAAGLTNDVYTSELSLNDIATWGPRVAPGFVAPPPSCFGLVCFPGMPCVCGNGTVARMDLTTPASVTVPPWTARALFGVFRLLSPQSYSLNTSGVVSQYTVPATSWVMYGGSGIGQDVWLSTNKGASWSVVAGSPNDPTIPNGFWASFVGLEGQAVCKSSTADVFVSMGGKNSTTWLNDVWTSPNGQSWVQRQVRGATGATAWPARAYHLCSVTSDGLIYATGGNSASYSAVDDDTYVSADGGTSWSLVTVTSTYPSRAAFFGGAAFTRAFNRTVMYAAGGVSFRNYNDVWVTSDGARTWFLVTATAPWLPRADTTLTFTDSGVMVLYGGQMNSFERLYTDMWMSVDGGYNWWQIAPCTFAIPRSYAATMFDEQGYLWVFGGNANVPGGNAVTKDVFRSTLPFDDASIRTWLPVVEPNAVLPRNASNGAIVFGLLCWPGVVAPGCIDGDAPVLPPAAPSSSAAPVPSSAAAPASASSSAAAATATTAAPSSSVAATARASSSSSTGTISPPPEAASSSSSLSDGALAGVIVACVVGGIILLVVVVLLVLRSRSGKASTNASSYANNSRSSHTEEMEMSSA